MAVHRNAAVRQPRRQPGGRNGKVTVEQVNPGIWKTALRIARGDVSRIRIVSPVRVEIYERR